jgi:hypothetical protein
MWMTLSWTLAAVAAVAFGYFLYAWSRRRGERRVICPETLQPVGVELAAGHVALTGELRLGRCDRWPERANCGQECLAQIADSPDGCLVRTRVAAWYHGASCVFCGKEIPDFGATEHAPAVLSPDNVTRSWQEVHAAELDQVLTTHRPVCWDCHVVQTLYRKHPELVTERPAKWQDAVHLPTGEAPRPSPVHDQPVA